MQKEMLIKLVDEMVTSKDENFGNAGEMVKLFEKTKARRANRLAQLHAGGQTLTRENVPDHRGGGYSV